ncbi:MAG: M10 family metallopeptidase C-terminal domain-containing protein [Pseudomonadota bacterium]
MAKLYSGDAGTDSVLTDAGLGSPRVNSWSTASTVGSGVSLTYDWMTSAPSGAPAGGFQPFTSAQRTGALKAMDLASEVANINFTRQSSGTADIEFGTLAFGGSPFGYTAGLASTRWTVTFDTTYYTEAKVYLTNSFSTMLNQSEGSAGFATLVHELGHALGLEHPFEGRLAPPGTDSEQYSIMSYTGHPNMNTNASTFLLYDIAALQYLYGANMSTRTGNSTYSWSNNEAAIQAIWDAGGEDTISASNQSRRVLINLNDGEFSSIGSNGSGGNAVNNIAIARNARIENAIGGSGNDTIRGNEYANHLEGRNGNDTLIGGSGNDYFEGGDDGDNIQGGSGTDWIGYYDSDAAVKVNLATRVVSGGDAQGDTISSIERVTGSNGYGDDLRGTSGDNYLRGFGGNDYLVGEDGADQIRGGSGIDWIGYYNSDAAVRINLSTNSASGGHADGDTISSIERVTGSNGYGDDLRGTSDDNYLRGYGGNDYLVGYAGADQIRGGSGTDWVGYYTSNAAVTVNLSSGSASGGHAEGDTLSSIERVTGSNGFGDDLRGTSGDNYIRGYGGDDYMIGYAGADQIRGGSGTDWVSYYTSNAAVKIDLSAGTASGGHAEGDILSSIERLTGSNGYGDDLRGNSSDNYLRGYGGNDYFMGYEGADEIWGGNGTDWIGYFTSDAAVTINLATGAASGGHADGDVFTSIERVTGSNGFGDDLTGSDAANYLRGYGGDDRLDGRGGNDQLLGGTGNDTFVFQAGWDDDIITDFDVSSGDVLDFTALGITQADLDISYGANDTTITYDGNSIVLEGTTTTLTEDEFLFV